MWEAQLTECLFFRDTNGHIHWLYNVWNPPPLAQIWNNSDITAAAGVPGWAATAATYPVGFVWTQKNTLHVFYRATDYHIYELYYDGSWHWVDVTSKAGAPLIGSSALAAYVWEWQGTKHVVFQSNGDVQECYFDGTWHYEDLSKLSGAPAAISLPAGYAWEGGFSQHIFYLTTKNDLCELYYNAGGSWRYNDLTVSIGAPRPDSAPSGYVWEGGKSQHVVYRSPLPRETVVELYMNAGGPWQINSFLQEPPTSWPPFGYAWELGNSEHIVYVAETGGDIEELYLNGGSSWELADLTIASGLQVTPSSLLAGYVWEGESCEFVVYVGSDKHIYQIAYRAGYQL